MKRVLTIMALMLTLATVSSAKVRYGVEAGALVHKMKFNKKLASSDKRAGFFIGPKLSGSLPLGFGVDAALLYSNRSAEIDSDIDEHSKTLNYLTVPVNLRWQFGTDRFAPYIATGPQWDFLVGDNKLYTSDGLKTAFETNVVSWNLGVGLWIIEHVQIGFSWNLPITSSGKLNKYAFDDVKGQFSDVVEGKTKLKNKEWAIRINYFF